MKSRSCLLGVAGALLLTAAVAQAQQCTNYDYRGLYSAVVIGNFISPPPGVPAGPTARVGHVEVDGKGTASIVTTLSLSGFVLNESYGGTYTINPDCSATVTLLVPFPGAPQPVPFVFKGVLADEGRVFDLILTNPQGTDIRIILHKQRRLACTNGDLNGDYSLNMAGTVIRAFGQVGGPFARVGLLKFDGLGNFTGSVNTSYAGLITPEVLKGTYQMKSDCTFTASFNTTQGQSWFGMMADSIGGAKVIESQGGTVVTGTLISVR